MQQSRISDTTWCLLLLIPLLSYGYCTKLCYERNPEPHKDIINLKLECLHNGNVYLTWNYDGEYMIFFQVEYLCYSEESEKNNTSYSIAAENINNSINFLTNKSHCIAQGCYSLDARQFPLPVYWMPLVTCNITEPTVDDESTIPTINHTNSSVIIPLPSTSEMQTLSTTNSNTASSSTMETIISVTTSSTVLLSTSASVDDSSGSESSIIPPETVLLYSIGIVVLIFIIMMAIFILGLCLWLKRKSTRIAINLDPISALNAITLIPESPSLLSCKTNIAVPIHKPELQYTTINLTNCLELKKKPFSENNEKSSSLNSLCVNSELYDDKPSSLPPDIHNISLTSNDTTDVMTSDFNYTQHISDEDSGEGTQESTESTNGSFQFTGNIFPTSGSCNGYIVTYPQALATSSIIPDMNYEPELSDYEID